MAKNELIKFACGDEPNIIAFDEWEKLPDVKTGFKSGLARSDRFNRALAQGALASNVIGEFIVETLQKNVTLESEVYVDFKAAVAKYVPGNIADHSIEQAKLSRSVNERLEQVERNRLAISAINDSIESKTKLKPGSVTQIELADGSVTTPKIAAQAVTTEKIKNASVTSEKLSEDLRDKLATAGEIGALAIKEFMLDTGAVSEKKLSAASVTTEKIVDGAVTESKLKDSSVSINKLSSDIRSKLNSSGAIGEGDIKRIMIADGAINGAKLDSSSVTGTKLADYSVSTSKLSSDAVTESKIKDGSVTRSKLSSRCVGEYQLDTSAVTTSKIKDRSITADKLSADLALKLNSSDDASYILKSGDRGNLSGYEGATSYSSMPTISESSPDSITISSSGYSTLRFSSSSSSKAWVKLIRLKASSTTTLSLSGAKWATGKAPAWGAYGNTLILSAVGIGGEVIVNVLFNSEE